MDKKMIIVFLVFIVFGVGLFYILTAGNVGVTYDTTPVTKGEVSQFVQDVGRVSSSHIRRYYGNGMNEVEEMSLKLGDRVEKGQLLIKYEDNMALIDLEIQRVEKQIEALKAAYNDALSGADAETVSSAATEIASIRSQLETATSNKVRTESLYNEGVATLLELEQAEDRIIQLQSSLSIAQNNYNQLTKDISDNVREKFEAEIAALALSIEILEKTREDFAVYSDIEGIVTALNTFEGDKPSVGMMIVEIQDPTKKVVLVDFMVEDAIQIGSGLKAAVDDIILDININDLVVTQVYPTAFVTLSELGVKENRQTVEIGLSEAGDLLPFGLELDTKVMVEAPRELLLVPVGAVVEKDSKEYVEVLIDGKPVEREIVTGIRVDENVEIINGVEEGEQVILNYQED